MIKIAIQLLELLDQRDIKNGQSFKVEYDTDFNGSIIVYRHFQGGIDSLIINRTSSGKELTESVNKVTELIMKESFEKC